jgi:acyl-CoA reductase-like NAD-dependent aldehyde dehydrogenase
MSFTGSPEVGRLIGESCGRNLVPAKLELGGKGAAVLFDDVATEQAAEALAAAVTLNAGQVCCTATRWLVHEGIRDAFVAKAVSVLGGMKIGYGSEAETQIGPLVSEKQRSRVLGYIEKGRSEGARTILAGGRAQVPGRNGGFYVKPALLEGLPDNVCAREEIFGPVAFVMTFRSESEAIDLVNRSPYGLANSVWSRDLDRANRVAEQLVAGNSWINGHNLFAHGVPYGGCNLSGCGGGVLGPDTLEDYYRKQSVIRPLA